MSDDFGTTHRLVQQAQAGDGAARDELFARYLPQVGRLVAAQLGVRRDQLPADAEDLVQEAILRAMRGLPRFEMRSPGAFLGWLAEIVKNCLRSQLRRRSGPGERHLWQRYGDLDLHESLFAGPGPTPSRGAIGHEGNARIEAALLQLPQLYRDVLARRYLAGMSHAEIAAAIGRTEANCRKLVERAKALLGIELAKLPPAPPFP